jgi:ATP-dependent Clp protease protease subunit
MEDKSIPFEKRKPIKILIDSNGGLLMETMSLAEIILKSQTPVYTIGICKCYSAAGILLMSGHKRFALDNAICMIHSGSGGCEGSFEQVEQQTKSYKNLIEAVKVFIVDHTKISTPILSKKMKEEWYINAKEMLQYKIIDSIITDGSVIWS